MTMEEVKEVKEAKDEKPDMARLNRATLAKLRVIATARRQSIGDALDSVAAKAIDREYRLILQAAEMASTTVESTC